MTIGSRRGCGGFPCANAAARRGSGQCMRRCIATGSLWGGERSHAECSEGADGQTVGTVARAETTIEQRSRNTDPNAVCSGASDECEWLSRVGPAWAAWLSSGGRSDGNSGRGVSNVSNGSAGGQADDGSGQECVWSAMQRGALRSLCARIEASSNHPNAVICRALRVCPCRSLAVSSCRSLCRGVPLVHRRKGAACDRLAKQRQPASIAPPFSSAMSVSLRHASRMAAQCARQHSRQAGQNTRAHDCTNGATGERPPAGFSAARWLCWSVCAVRPMTTVVSSTGDAVSVPGTTTVVQPTVVEKLRVVKVTHTHEPTQQSRAASSSEDTCIRQDDAAARGQ